MNGDVLSSRYSTLSKSLAVNFSVVTAISIAWTVFVAINNIYLFWWTASTSWAHFVYFPAGFKLVVTMLFGVKGACGIFVGSIFIFADIFPFLPLGSRTIMAGLYAAAPLVVCSVFQLFTGKHHPWTNLRFVDIVTLSVCSSLLSATVILLGLVAVSNYSFTIYQFYTLFVGDLLGIIFFFLIIASVRWFFRSYFQ